jgi:hypothetical protein
MPSFLFYANYYIFMIITTTAAKADAAPRRFSPKKAFGGFELPAEVKNLYANNFRSERLLVEQLQKRVSPDFDEQREGARGIISIREGSMGPMKNRIRELDLGMDEMLYKPGNFDKFNGAKWAAALVPRGAFDTLLNFVLVAQDDMVMLAFLMAAREITFYLHLPVRDAHLDCLQNNVLNPNYEIAATSLWVIALGWERNGFNGFVAKNCFNAPGFRLASEIADVNTYFRDGVPSLGLGQRLI